MSPNPQVSIVLGAYNRFEFLKLAIESARQEAQNIPHEIIVVDGGSDDGSLEWLILQKDVLTIVQHNRGEWHGNPVPRQSWGYFMNLAFRSARADYILMMSDDTVFHSGAIANGVAFIQQKQAAGHKIGAVPFYFHDVGHDPQDSYKIATQFEQIFLNHGIYYKPALLEVGFADEATFEFFAADVDICLKLIHAGYEIAPCSTAFMLHCPNHPLRHLNTPSDKWMRDMQALVDKWQGVFVSGAIDLLHGYTKMLTITYHDPDNLARVFDEAIAHADHATNQSSQERAIDPDIRLATLENRLNSLLTAVRYNIHLSEQTTQKQTQQLGEWGVFYKGWHSFLPQWGTFWHRRTIRGWRIFDPLRAIKRRLDNRPKQQQESNQ